MVQRDCMDSLLIVTHATNDNVHNLGANRLNTSWPSHDLTTFTHIMNNSNKSQAGVSNEQPVYAQVIIVLMYVLIILVAVGGNLLFSYIIVMNPKMRSLTNLFLLNIAISDIVKAVICNPFTFIANLILLYWPYGEFMCQVVTYIQVVAVFLSSFTLVAMSVDRYVAIVKPMRPRLSKRAFVVTMIIIWLLSLSAPLPTAILSKIIVQPSGLGLCLEDFENNHNKYIYSIAIMILQYFAPLAVITVTNSHIGYIVWIKRTPGEAEQDRDRRMAAAKRRLVKMIIIVVSIYAVCWLPLHVITLVGDSNPTIYNNPHMELVWLCAHWLAMSHSCYNPIVYFSLNATFRKSLKHLTTMCRHKQKRLQQRFSLRTNKSDVWDRDTDMYGSVESLQTKSTVGVVHALHRNLMKASLPKPLLFLFSLAE
ncbi:RYamide receptor-like isoform X2 [Biomphalaria glabrata]|uniref:RYamide receptor-like isoform X2 n=1 Tax=Biomphalaria glabrata TaxID=6526 RepID=A0A9W2ZSX7_BIOGL|nr:RYamide receptor-like isoform X2 [Biomphalaria glabrata]